MVYVPVGVCGPWYPECPLPAAPHDAAKTNSVNGASTRILVRLRASNDVPAKPAKKIHSAAGGGENWLCERGIASADALVCVFSVKLRSRWGTAWFRSSGPAPPSNASRQWPRQRIGRDQ